MQRTMSTTENLVALGRDMEKAAIRPLSHAEVDTTGSGPVGATIGFFATYGVCKFGEDQGWWKLTDCIDTFLRVLQEVGKLVIP